MYQSWPWAWTYFQASLSQAPCASGMDDSLNATPIPRANASPSFMPIPPQVVSPKPAMGKPRQLPLLQGTMSEVLIQMLRDPFCNSGQK